MQYVMQSPAVRPQHIVTLVEQVAEHRADHAHVTIQAATTRGIRERDKRKTWLYIALTMGHSIQVRDREREGIGTVAMTKITCNLHEIEMTRMNLQQNITRQPKGC